MIGRLGINARVRGFVAVAVAGVARTVGWRHAASGCAGNRSSFHDGPTDVSTSTVDIRADE
jgi:hypothetical protein